MHRPDSPWLRRAARVFGNVACFFAALAASAVLIGKVLPFPEVPDIAPRWRMYAENRDAFDTVFVGSSRFRHQIIPRLFDEQTAALGTPTRSVNLGYSGMWPPENFYFLRRLLALRPPHLKWVFFSLIDGSTWLDERDAATQRTVYWHDWQHTMVALRMVWAARDRTPADKRQLTLLHGRIFLQQSLHLGRGAAAIEKHLKPPKVRRTPAWVEQLGFDPEPEPGTLTGPALTAYLEKLEILRQPRPPSSIRPGFLAELRKIQAEVRAAGAEIVFVLPPTVSTGENFTEPPAGLPALLFNDVHRDARLYDPELHYDAGHLNARGAAEFTRLLAARFAAWQSGRR